MTYAAWVSLFSPAVAVGVIALAGRRITGRQAGWIATGATFVSFVASVVVLVQLWRREPEERSRALDHLDLALGGRLQRRLRGRDRPAFRPHDARRLGGRLPDPHLRDRLHGRGPGGAALPRVQGALHLLDAPPRPGGEPAAASRRLGHGRALLLPADQLLAPAGERGRRGQEGVHDERGRRRDLRARALHPHPADRLGRLRDRVLAGRAEALGTARRSPRSSRSASWAAPSPSRRRSRSTPGSRTRWRARRRSAPSSTRPRW